MQYIKKRGQLGRTNIGGLGASIRRRAQKFPRSLNRQPSVETDGDSIVKRDFQPAPVTNYSAKGRYYQPELQRLLR